MMADERLTMTIAEFARLYGCSRQLAYSLARQDRLPVKVIHLGEHRMVLSRSAVLDLLAERKTEERES
jgi:predicted DNA-binding transcriptional regulator AlpA